MLIRDFIKPPSGIRTFERALCRFNISRYGEYRNAGRVTRRRNVDHLLTD